MKRILLALLFLLGSLHAALALGVAHKDIKVWLNKADGIYALGDSAIVYGK